MREGGEVGVGARGDCGLAPDDEEGDDAQAAGKPPRHPRLGRAPEMSTHAADCPACLNAQDDGTLEDFARTGFNRGPYERGRHWVGASQW